MLTMWWTISSSSVGASSRQPRSSATTQRATHGAWSLRFTPTRCSSLSRRSRGGSAPYGSRAIWRGARCTSRSTSASTAGSPPGTSSPSTASEEHTSELQSPDHLVCRLLLEKKKTKHRTAATNLYDLYDTTQHMHRL